MAAAPVAVNRASRSQPARESETMTARNARRFIKLLCGLTLSMVSGVGFAAPNLIANPSFDDSLAGWTVLTAYTATWSPVDASGNVNSGSARVVNEQNPGAGNIPLVLGQCVRVTPSTEYSFGGRLMVPAGQPAGTHAELFGATYASGDCSGTASLFMQESASTVGAWASRSRTFTTAPTVNSVLLAIGAFKPAGVTANAAAQFDDLYLQRGPGGTGFVIGPSMSASWYDPAQSGHGITLELLDGARAWMCWFTFDTPGNRAWICAVGAVGGVTIDFAQAFMVAGGKFPPLFDPSHAVQVPWGSIAITFTGCDSGTMTWSTTAAGFQSGSMPLSRLTSLWGNACH